MIRELPEKLGTFQGGHVFLAILPVINRGFCSLGRPESRYKGDCETQYVRKTPLCMAIQKGFRPLLPQSWLTVPLYL